MNIGTKLTPLLRSLDQTTNKQVHMYVRLGHNLEKATHIFQKTHRLIHQARSLDERAKGC